MDPDISIDEWLDTIGGITKIGREKLEKATVVSLTAVRCLSEEDIVEIKLSVGDRGVFKAGWESLRLPKDLPKPLETPEEEAKLEPDKSYTIADLCKFFGQSSLGATGGASGGVPLQQPSQDGRVEALTAAGAINAARPKAKASNEVTVHTLAKDKLLNRLAADFVQEGVKDTLSLQELNLFSKGEKALLPINFCTVFSGIALEEEEVLGCGQFAGRLVWQSGRGNIKRPTPDKLSFGQFFEANSRILHLLNLDTSTYTEYLDYLRQLGILLQTFTASSVFTLDHIHRQFIFETQGKWNVVENTLQNSILKKKEDASRHFSGQNVGNNSARRVDNRTYQKSTKPPGADDKVCWLFNLYKGCHFGSECYYPHVCSVESDRGMCRQNHPAYKHGDASHERPSRSKPVDGKQSA
jgi:hypothetical protein